MKIALVTGSSRGLGKSMALHLSTKGYNVVVTYHRAGEEAEAVVDAVKANGRDAVALQLDTSDSGCYAPFADELKNALMAHWQTEAIDLLVNNAGIGVYAPIAETTMAQFDTLFSIHMKGPFFLTQMLMPSLKEGGTIINISSGLTRFSLPGYGAYAMMKGAVEVMTRYLAAELGSRNITVNTIAPGAIETDFGGGAVRDNEAVNRFVASQTALGRAGVPDDIGAALAALVSEECRWMNGQRIEISGGMFL